MRTDGMRPLVEAVTRDIARLAGRRGADADADAAHLERSWAALVDFLALGPAPEWRACPFCQQPCVRAATRCASCWRRITPLPSAADRAQGSP